MKKFKIMAASLVIAASNLAFANGENVTTKSKPLVELNNKAKDLWLTDFEQAKKIAKEKKLPIVINFTGSDWCGWCIKLDREVFAQPAFIKYAKKNLVLFKADFPRGGTQTKMVKDQNRKLASAFGISGYPTIMVLNSNAQKIDQTGYRRGGADAYVENLKKMIGAKK